MVRHCKQLVPGWILLEVVVLSFKWLFEVHPWMLQVEPLLGACVGACRALALLDYLI